MFTESVIIAWDGLKTNKMRAFLTMLGIIIGVGAVIVMVSLGFGVRDKVQKSISSLGSNLIIVTPGGRTASGARLAPGSGTRLTMEDVKAIEKEVPGIAYIAPSVRRQYQIIAGNQNWTTNVEGGTPSTFDIRSFTVADGNLFTNRELETRARVAVIGKTVADNLFYGDSPVGQTIRINKAPFKVVGVLNPKGQMAMGADQDDIVFIPITTAQQRMMAITFVQQISVQAESEEVLTQVQMDTEDLLRVRHKITGDKDDDFSVQNLAAIMETATEATNSITMLLANVAAISLLVGGIGIMNIMLVSVTERTREIGIRKALGATYTNILLQFLIEAVVIGVVGGVIGILLGIGAANFISYYAGFDTIISWLAVVVAFSFSVAIGLFFGIYPARKAALLSPIDALRYE